MHAALHCEANGERIRGAGVRVDMEIGGYAVEVMAGFAEV
jgi:hypothetical protein